MTSYLTSLNAQQQRAVYQPMLPTMVLAGPGTGKTRTLIGRILVLLEEPYNMPPEAILAVTFTNQARNEMYDRIVQHAERNVSKITVSTIHGFCLRVLQKHGSLVYVPENFMIADEQAQFRLLSRCVNSQDVQSLHHIRDIISQYRFGVTYALAVDETVVMHWIQQYEDQLARNRMIDFDQILLKVLELFETYPDIAEFYRDRFQAILIDEFQDIDSMQYAIFALMTTVQSNIFMVCDEDQSIYAFRGADMTNIARFQSDFHCSVEQGNLIILEENYRSQQSLITLANTLIQPYRAIPKNIHAVFERKEQPHYHECVDEKETATLLFTLLSEYHAAGIAYSDMTILCPTNYLAQDLEPDFIQHEIPYVLESSQSLADFDDLEKMKILLSLVYTTLLQEKDTEDRGYDLAYERFFLMFSCLTTRTFQLVKYQQGHDTFHATIDALYTLGKSAESEWFLDIEKEEFCTAVTTVNDLRTALIEDVSRYTTATLTDVLRVVGDYLPLTPETLVFSCGDTLVDPKDMHSATESSGVFYWFLQNVTEPSTLTITARNARVAQSAKYMLETTLHACGVFGHIADRIQSIVDESSDMIIVRTSNPECALYFKDGMYEFFKFLQMLHYDITSTPQFAHVIALDIQMSDDKEVSCIHLYEMKDKKIVSRAEFHNSEHVAFDTFMASIRDDFCRSQPIIAVLTNNIPVVYEHGTQVFRVFRAVFASTTAFQFFGIHAFLKYHNATALLDTAIECQEEFGLRVVSLLQMIANQESVLARKTSLEQLIPVLHIGLYCEYLSDPTRKGVNFVRGSEPLNLFLWGHTHMDHYTYPDHIKTLWQEHQVGIGDFIGVFREEMERQMPFEQGFPSMLALSLRYTKPDRLENMRDFLNNVSLLGVNPSLNLDAVHISTIHAAKGKECLVGIVIGVEDGILPSSHSLRYKASYNDSFFLDEQRRVFYVALTRIRQYMHIIHTQTRRERKSIPSRFLAEINCMEII